MRTLGLFLLTAILSAACGGRQIRVEQQHQAVTTYKCAYNTNERCKVVF